jgi:hypothetical protein
MIGASSEYRRPKHRNSRIKGGGAQIQARLKGIHPPMPSYCFEARAGRCRLRGYIPFLTMNVKGKKTEDIQM